MFTGLVKEIGKIKGVIPNREGKELIISSHELISEIGIDDSVAVNGVCQTVTKFGKDFFHVQAVHGTLEKTTLNHLRLGERVNLELAMKMSDRLGGHLVQGHVNDTGKIKSIKSFGQNYLIEVSFPERLGKYILQEGSICIDGISLTVYEERESSFVVTMIPHTFKNTIFNHKRVGDLVNLEVDILAKYVEKMLNAHMKGPSKKTQSKVTEQWLREKGF